MPRTTTSDIFSLVVGQAIRDARREAGITQAELARRLGTSGAYVSSVETGRANPTVGWLSVVASALGAEVEIGFRIRESIAEPNVPEPAIASAVGERTSHQVTSPADT